VERLAFAIVTNGSEFGIPSVGQQPCFHGMHDDSEHICGAGFGSQGSQGGR
jgi:hypothetical protein